MSARVLRTERVVESVFRLASSRSRWQDVLDCGTGLGHYGCETSKGEGTTSRVRTSRCPAVGGCPPPIPLERLGIARVGLPCTRVVFLIFL